jgi:hypothetical protein
MTMCPGTGLLIHEIERGLGSGEVWRSCRGWAPSVRAPSHG